jgi:hypothetical protein
MQANGNWCSQALQMMLTLRIVFLLSGGHRLKVEGAEDIAASAEATSGTPARGTADLASTGH